MQSWILWSSKRITQMLMLLLISKFIYLVDENMTSRWHEYCMSDYEQCPQCFSSIPFDGGSSGDALQTHCRNIFDDIELYTTIDSSVNALFGSRNLQYGQIDGNRVVLKHPSNMEKLSHLKDELCATMSIENGLRSDCDLWQLQESGEQLDDALATVFMNTKRYDGLQLCPGASAASNYERAFKPAHMTVSAFWILSYVSPDIILFETLSNAVNSSLSPMVPKLHRNCGFTAVVANRGKSLYSFYGRSFYDRVYLAKQLLEAAFAFSYGHEGLRIYLTDATPDNIVVDESTLAIAYIDLDNVLMVDSSAYNGSSSKKPLHWDQIHRHEIIDCDNCFSYVPDELCAHHLSDINLFATCQLLIKASHSSEQRGLLHSIPDDVLQEFPELPNALKYCVKCPLGDCVNRFEVAKELLTVFQIVVEYHQEESLQGQM